MAGAGRGADGEVSVKRAFAKFDGAGINEGVETAFAEVMRKAHPLHGGGGGRRPL